MIRWIHFTRVLSLVLLGMLLPGAGSGVEPPTWQPPIDTPLRVSSHYRPPPTPYAAGHRGIDLPAHPGAVVIAPVSGTVSFVGQVADRQVLSIRVDARTVLTFEPLETELSIGNAVVRGQEIGAAGSGGHCASACVHLGVRIDTAYVNPLRYFFAKPVLLPWAN